MSFRQALRQRLCALLALLKDPWFLGCVSLAAAVHVLVIALALAHGPHSFAADHSPVERMRAPHSGAPLIPARYVCSATALRQTRLAAALARSGSLKLLGRTGAKLEEPARDSGHRRSGDGADGVVQRGLICEQGVELQLGAGPVQRHP